MSHLALEVNEYIPLHYLKHFSLSLAIMEIQTLNVRSSVANQTTNVPTLTPVAWVNVHLFVDPITGLAVEMPFARGSNISPHAHVLLDWKVIPMSPVMLLNVQTIQIVLLKELVLITNARILVLLQILVEMVQNVGFLIMNLIVNVLQELLVTEEHLAKQVNIKILYAIFHII